MPSNRLQSTNVPRVTCLLACGVFRPALRHLGLSRRYPNLRISYLPSNLHSGPQRLESRLRQKIRATEKRNERVVLLYGDCFPNIQYFCEQHGVVKVPGFHCYEMLLGRERFQQLIEEAAGTYFVERDLITNFKQYCLDPLELHDEEMRRLCFGNYRRLLYVRQPADPDLASEAGTLAEFLQLSLEVRDADYSYLEGELAGLMLL